jgi:hypothetical protein
LQFFPDLTEEEILYGWFQLLLTLHVCLCRLCPISSVTELSAVVFGQHIHLISFLVFFLLGLSEGQSLQSNSVKEGKLKENISKEIANIPAEHLQRVNQDIFRWCEECLRV